MDPAAVLADRLGDHVDEGRDKLNFSNWGEFGKDAHDAVDVIKDGSMPPSQYTLLHGDAKLTDAEQQILIAALEVMDPDRGGGDGGGGDD